MSAQSTSAASKALRAINTAIAPVDLKKSICEFKAIKRLPRSAAEVIELGSRLIILKNTVPPGNFIKSIESLGINPRYARKMIRAAKIFQSYPEIISKDIDPTPLLELLNFDESELSKIEAGETVHGINLDNIADKRVKDIRQATKSSKEYNAHGFKTNSPVLKADAESIEGLQPLQPGDRVKSLYAGRDGAVVRTYEDGSASVLWDDGEPQAEGLAHERMPRKLLKSTDEYNAHGFKVDATVWKADAAPSPSSNTDSTPQSAPESYPAVYSLTPGKFNGCELCILQHEGRAWLMLEEVAAVVGETSERVSEIEEILGKFFDLNFPAGHFAKVRFASSSLVARILDEHAVRFCEEALGAKFVAWFSAQTSAPAEPVDIDIAKPLISGATQEMTMKSALQELDHVNVDIYRMMSRLESQIKAINTILAEHNPRDGAYPVEALIEIAEGLIAPYDNLVERQDDAMSALANRLFREPEDGAILPESVWLDLVTELMADHAGGYTNNEMDDLATTVGIMAKHGNSPEVVRAVDLVQEYVERQGAVLYDHYSKGEQPGQGRVAFYWKDGLRSSQRLTARPH